MDCVLCWCIINYEIPLILIECHDNMVGGHFVRDVTSRNYKVVIGGPHYYLIVWLMQYNTIWCLLKNRQTNWLFSNATHSYISPCTIYEMGIWFFFGPINPLSRHGKYQYILVANDYVTKWPEAEGTRKYDKHVVLRF